jgi:hypothetical protein
MLKRKFGATAGLAACFGLLIAGAVQGDEGSGRHRGDDQKDFALEVIQGYRISPVPLNLIGKNRELVGLGSYIVNAHGGCNDCHTYPAFAQGGDPYQGQPTAINSPQYLTGGRQFGPFTSRNLTPDLSGKPAGLTFDEFEHVLRTGAEPDRPPGSHLPPILQVMPWPVYSQMTRRDMRAIYEYLSAIPSRPDNPAPGP